MVHVCFERAAAVPGGDDERARLAANRQAMGALRQLNTWRKLTLARLEGLRKGLLAIDGETDGGTGAVVNELYHALQSAVTAEWQRRKEAAIRGREARATPAAPRPATTKSAAPMRWTARARRLATEITAVLARAFRATAEQPPPTPPRLVWDRDARPAPHPRATSNAAPRPTPAPRAFRRVRLRRAA